MLALDALPAIGTDIGGSVAADRENVEEAESGELALATEDTGETALGSGDSCSGDIC